MESTMDKRNTLDAIYAESLVFESNFGPTVVPLTAPSKEAVKQAELISAWNAAALACEHIGTTDETETPSVH
jgi:hypothetical protein